MQLWASNKKTERDCEIRTIPLTQGKVAIVDADDYEWLSQWEWYANKIDRTYYAVRNKIRSKILMHREILGLKCGDNVKTDHRNGDGLDNRRENLRKCTDAENQHNQNHLRSKKTSVYKGVSWNKMNKNWRAAIWCNYKIYYLGSFGNEVDAAKAYDKAAKELFGEFAYLNFPMGIVK